MTLIILSNDAFLIQQIEQTIEYAQLPIEIIGHCYAIEEGIKTINALKPNIILLDMEMPKAKKSNIREHQVVKTALMIMLTTNYKLYNSFRGLGFLVVISKPFDQTDLINILRTA